MGGRRGGRERCMKGRRELERNSDKGDEEAVNEERDKKVWRK